jgi:uncharacterized protein YbaR (Trm112 family)
MREQFLDLLCCPACHGKVTIAVAEQKDDDIISGTLTCSSCAAAYPIKDGIPYMLVDE